MRQILFYKIEKNIQEVANQQPLFKNRDNP